MAINRNKSILLTVLLFACRYSDTVNNQIKNPNPQHHSKDDPNNSNNDSVLRTGWYLVSETRTGYKRILAQTNENYNINPEPIVTVKNFDKLTLFHEKNCYALFTWLDKNGSKALNLTKQESKGKKLAFILNDKLLRIQPVDDPQFAKVENDTDPRIYGEVLTFPCNSFLPQEMKNYKAIIESER